MKMISQSDEYRTPRSAAVFSSRISPTWAYYSRMIRVIFNAAAISKKWGFDREEFYNQSHQLFKAIEAAGGQITVSGLDHLRNLNSPVVYIANHMSSLETFILPCMILPFQDMCFIIKESLTRYPVFKHIMLAQDPIAVGRINPRDDLKTILTEGVKRIENNKSVVVFPQTTRMLEFDLAQFNSIGVKLALKAGVPVIPVALRTDAWQMGKLLKDYGTIDKSLPIYFNFGNAIPVEGNGREAQARVVEFIKTHMEAWFGTESVLHNSH